MDDFNLFFYQAESEYADVKSDIIEKVIADSIEEFTGYSKEHQSRQAEIKELNEKIKDLSHKINKCRNIKNARSGHQKINKEKAIKRKNLKKEIDICRLRLDEIEEEVRPIAGTDARRTSSDGSTPDDLDYTGSIPSMKSLSSLTKTPFV